MPYPAYVVVLVVVTALDVSGDTEINAKLNPRYFFKTYKTYKKNWGDCESCGNIYLPIKQYLLQKEWTKFPLNLSNGNLFRFEIYDAIFKF